MRFKAAEIRFETLRQAPHALVVFSRRMRIGNMILGPSIMVNDELTPI
ncbi:hypothetical protein [Rhizobium sp. BR 314]